YHSGLIPAGADAKGSAFTPRFHGNSAASAPSVPIATYQAINSRNRKLGKNFISRRNEGFAVHAASTLGGTLMPWRCTRKRWIAISTVTNMGRRLHGIHRIGSVWLRLPAG